MKRNSFLVTTAAASLAATLPIPSLAKSDTLSPSEILVYINELVKPQIEGADLRWGEWYLTAIAPPKNGRRALYRFQNSVYSPILGWSNDCVQIHWRVRPHDRDNAIKRCKDFSDWFTYMLTSRYNHYNYYKKV